MNTRKTRKAHSTVASAEGMLLRHLGARARTDDLGPNRLKIRCDRQVTISHILRGAFQTQLSRPGPLRALHQTRGTHPPHHRRSSVLFWTFLYQGRFVMSRWSPGEQRLTVRHSLASAPTERLTLPPSLILANTEELHKENETLRNRVRELETALETLQAKHSDEPHPLLAPQLLITGIVRHDSDDPNSGLTLPAFGSLTLGDDVSLSVPDLCPPGYPLSLF